MEQQTEGIEVRIAHNGEDYEARTLDVLERCVELVGFSEDSAKLALVHLKDGVAQVWGCEPEIGRRGLLRRRLPQGGRRGLPHRDRGRRPRGRGGVT